MSSALWWVLKGRAAAPPAIGLHHRGFDFEIAAVVEEVAHGAEHLGALDEDVAAVEVHEEVDIALAVAELDVGQAVVLLRQGKHGLGEEGDAFRRGRLARRAGAEEIAGDADVVAEVEQLVEVEGVLADGVFADVDLQALRRPAGGWQSRLCPAARMAMMRPATATGTRVVSNCSPVHASCSARMAGMGRSGWSVGGAKVLG